MQVTRSEQLVFNFQVSGADYRKYKEMLNQLGPLNLGNLQDDDTVKTTYTVYVDYIGKVTQNIKNILVLMESGVIVDANYSELAHGRSLIMELAAQMERFAELSSIKDLIQSPSMDAEEEAEIKLEGDDPEKTYLQSKLDKFNSLEMDDSPTLSKEEFFKEVFGDCVSEPKKSLRQKLKDWWNG